MKKLIPLVAAALTLAFAAMPTSAQAWYYHAYCHCVHHYYHHFYHFAYPQVFIDDAHVYVPPYYYYSPYSEVDHVLVHRSIEIGPEVHVVRHYSLFDAFFLVAP